MTGKEEVDNWFKDLKHPQKETMQALREAILNADSRMAECIKWKTPTFVFKGNLASINPAAKKFVSLMFHRGSEIPGDHPLLQGDANLVRTMKFANAADVAEKTAAIEAVVKAWCEWKA